MAVGVRAQRMTTCWLLTPPWAAAIRLMIGEAEMGAVGG
jgi:hypothetical protein